MDVVYRPTWKGATSNLSRALDPKEDRWQMGDSALSTSAIVAWEDRDFTDTGVRCKKGSLLLALLAVQKALIRVAKIARLRIPARHSVGRVKGAAPWLKLEEGGNVFGVVKKRRPGVGDGSRHDCLTIAAMTVIRASKVVLSRQW